jgi:hypothetical protein
VAEEHGIDELVEFKPLEDVELFDERHGKKSKHCQGVFYYFVLLKPFFPYLKLWVCLEVERLLAVKEVRKFDDTYDD